MIGRLRSVASALALVTGTIAALGHFVVLTTGRRRRLTLNERASWLHRWCGVGLKILGIQVARSGPLPTTGLLVANHLSYLDILVFSAMTPAVFISKIEVRSWPLFGLMARLGGSIFVNRRKLRSLPGVIAEAEAAMRSGALIVLFPEATTTDGSTLLPFRPALFEAAARAPAKVTASHISYVQADGAFDRELCWWGEMDLLPHLASTLAKSRIRAEVRIAAARPVVCRKEAAKNTYADVLRLNPHRSALQIKNCPRIGSGGASLRQRPEPQIP